MNLITIYTLLLLHWFADFVLQTDEQAKQKSTSLKFLIEHTLTYSSVFIIFGLVFMAFNIITTNILSLLIFVGITFISHTITDYFTSRINSRLYKNNKIHEFFVSVGFDQFLHYLQLFLTFYILFC